MKNYKQNLHTHTTYCDGKDTPEEMIQEALKKGFTSIGFSVYKYISYKRIVLAKELYSKGMSLSEACRCAGFNDYSAFYRAYTKIMGESPQKSIS